jgi:hypothetical protein
MESTAQHLQQQGAFIVQLSEQLQEVARALVTVSEQVKILKERP